MIYFEQYKQMINTIMKEMNGKVNTILRCHKYDFRYLETDTAMAKTDFNTANIHFNLLSIAENLGNKGYTYDYAYQFLIWVVVHELSHLDQDVTPSRYAVDMDYRAWVENTNDANAIKFMFEHLNLIHTCIGEFNFEFLQNAYMKIQQLGTGYIKTNPYKIISRITNSYLLDAKKNRFEYFDTVLMSINNESTGKVSHVIIKNHDRLMDVNEFFPIVNQIRSYSKLHAANIVTSPGAILIKLYLNDSGKRLEDVLYRIPSSFIA